MRFQERSIPVFALILLLSGFGITGTTDHEYQPESTLQGDATAAHHEDTRRRVSHFLRKRMFPINRLSPDAHLNAWNVGVKRISRARYSWRSLGPHGIITRRGETSGRINAIALSPADDNLILVGSANGGIWRSIDRGKTFVPVSDNIPGLAVGSIAFYRKKPTIVYAGMGDPVYGYLGYGVLKSTNSGMTWTRVSNGSLPSPCTISRIEVDRSDPLSVYLAQRSALGSPNRVDQENSGFYLSRDGGVSWVRKLAGEVYDIAIQPSNEKIIYAAVESESGETNPPGVYRSEDSGETWKPVLELTAGSEAAPVKFDKNADLYLRVAVTEAAPKTVYAFASGSIDGQITNRLLTSQDGGDTWASLAADSVDAFQPFWNLYLAADPRKADTLYAGAIDIYKTTDGGATWRNLTQNVELKGSPTDVVFTFGRSKLHVDQHALTFSPHNPDLMFAANDGGIFSSTDGGQSFISLNRTLTLTQFYSIASRPGTSIVYGGTQDNGTLAKMDRSGARHTWRMIVGSDGGYCAVCPSAPRRFFASVATGPISIVEDAHKTTEVVMDGFATDRKSFAYPLLTAGKNSRLYVGTYRLWVSSESCATLDAKNGKGWIIPGGDLDLTEGDGDVLTAISVSQSNERVIYTGSLQGRLMLSSDRGKSWNEITNGLPDRAISSISVHPANSATVFVTVSGFNSGHVFKTTNHGSSWRDISGNLPDVPVNSLLLDPGNMNWMYVGTDIGVFRSKSGGTRWELLNRGMPPVIVKAFAVGRGGKILAATFGRGVYALDY